MQFISRQLTHITTRANIISSQHRLMSSRAFNSRNPSTMSSWKRRFTSTAESDASKAQQNMTDSATKASTGATNATNNVPPPPAPPTAEELQFLRALHSADLPYLEKWFHETAYTNVSNASQSGSWAMAGGRGCGQFGWNPWGQHLRFWGHGGPGANSCGTRSGPNGTSFGCNPFWYSKYRCYRSAGCWAKVALLGLVIWCAYRTGYKHSKERACERWAESGENYRRCHKRGRYYDDYNQNAPTTMAVVPQPPNSVV